MFSPPTLSCVVSDRWCGCDCMQVATVQGEGMPIHNFPTEHGNLYCTYRIDFPQTLTAEQKEHVRLHTLLDVRAAEISDCAQAANILWLSKVPRTRRGQFQSFRWPRGLLCAVGPQPGKQTCISVAFWTSLVVLRRMHLQTARPELAACSGRAFSGIAATPRWSG